MSFERSLLTLQREGLELAGLVVMLCGPIKGWQHQNWLSPCQG